jgi:hypothetical protein
MALVALSAPALAMAGTYTWNQPNDFSGTQNAIEYGSDESWNYSASGGTMTYSSGTWSDGAGDSISTGSGDLTMQTEGDSATLTKINQFPPSQPMMISNTMAVSGLGVGCTLTSFPANGMTTASTFYVELSGGSTLTPCTASGTITITAVTPPVTLTSPTANSSFTAGQPQFSGAVSRAFDASQSVSVNVYSGSSVSGSPVQTLNTTESGGSYSVVPSSPLPNGTYTAQAVQDDPANPPTGPPDANTSSPVTFTLANTGPALTLNSLGSKPLLTSTPTFTGTAGTAAGDSDTVGIAIYAGSTISGSPVRTATGSVGSDGTFSIQSPALPDGRYTAVAGQFGNGLPGFSNLTTFILKAHPPSLTVNHPGPGGAIARTDLDFSGQAGDNPGDSPTISVSLYRGAKAKGRALGKRTVNVTGSTWSLRWNKKLKDGIYTISAVQTDDVGHTTRVTHTFIVVPTPTTVGIAVTLSRSGVASIPISCLASSGTCSGTVLAVTKGSYRTSSGAPSGHLRVLYAYVQISAGDGQTVRGRVPRAVAALLRRRKNVKIKVTTSFSGVGTSSAVRSVKRGS